MVITKFWKRQKLLTNVSKLLENFMEQNIKYNFVSLQKVILNKSYEDPYDAFQELVKFYNMSGYRERKIKNNIELGLIDPNTNQIISCLNTKYITIKWAGINAKKVLSLFEKQYPNDNRPRKTVEAIFLWLNNPNDDNNDYVYECATACYKAYLDASLVEYRSRSKEYRARNAASTITTVANAINANYIINCLNSFHFSNPTNCLLEIKHHRKILRSVVESFYILDLIIKSQYTRGSNNILQNKNNIIELGTLPKEILIKILGYV